MGHRHLHHTFGTKQLATTNTQASTMTIGAAEFTMNALNGS